MNQLIKLLGAACVAVSLSACTGNSDPVSFEQYSLIDGIGSEVLGSDYGIKVNLHGVIDGHGIVIRTSDVTFRPAVSHLWSGELADELRMLLAEAMLSEGVDHATAVNVEVLKFNGSLDGAVEIDAWISASDGERELFSKSFSYRAIQAENGYPALVRTLKRGWMQIADKAARLMAER